MLKRLVLILALLPAAAAAAPWKLDAGDHRRRRRRLGGPHRRRCASRRSPARSTSTGPPRARQGQDQRRGRATPPPASAVVDQLLRSRDYLGGRRSIRRSPSSLDKLTQTSKSTADIAGRITLRGVTKPVALQGPGHPRTARPKDDPDRFEAGFNLTGSIDRTAFGSTGGAARGRGGAAGAHPPADDLEVAPMRASCDGDRAAGAGSPAALHWTMAALILFQLGFGLYMVRFVPDLLARFTLTQTHKSWGFVVFVLAVVRVGWRLANRARPPLPAAMPRWQVARRRGQPRPALCLHVPDAALGLDPGLGLADPGPAADAEHGLRQLRAARPLRAGDRRGRERRPRRARRPRPSASPLSSRSTPAPRSSTSSSTATAFWRRWSAADPRERKPRPEAGARRRGQTASGVWRLVMNWSNSARSLAARSCVEEAHEGVALLLEPLQRLLAVGIEGGVAGRGPCRERRNGRWRPQRLQRMRLLQMI